jgi:hypothetical protein
MFSPDRPDEWTQDFTIIITGIATALAGQSPTPELLGARSAAYAHILADHRVVVTHSPKGTYSKRRAFFHISVVGKRLDGRWNFTPGALAKLCAAALRQEDQNPTQAVGPA